MYLLKHGDATKHTEEQGRRCGSKRGPAESPIDHQRYSIVHTVCLGVGVAGERREAQTQEKLFIFDFPQSIIGALV